MFYGREDQVARFESLWRKPVASFVVCRGSVAALPGWDAIMGLQFENLILNNFTALLPKMGLSDKLFISAAPYRNARESKGGGCQIDLLIQTRKTAYVVEIKRKREIGSEVCDEVAQKVRRLPMLEGVSARTCLVYDGALAPSVVADDFFDSLISVRELM